MGEAVPGQLFADLRQQVVREQPHCAQQPVQDVAEEGLRDTNKRPTLPQFPLGRPRTSTVILLFARRARHLTVGRTCSAMNTVLTWMAK